MALFILDHQETPVRELLDGGWLIQAGQGLEHGNLRQGHVGKMD
jgi:hypothetical protein